MGRDHYFNDKNLFQEIKIKCSSLIWSLLYIMIDAVVATLSVLQAGLLSLNYISIIFNQMFTPKLI